MTRDTKGPDLCPTPYSGLDRRMFFIQRVHNLKYHFGHNFSNSAPVSSEFFRRTFFHNGGHRVVEPSEETRPSNRKRAARFRDRESFHSSLNSSRMELPVRLRSPPLPFDVISHSRLCRPEGSLLLSQNAPASIAPASKPTSLKTHFRSRRNKRLRKFVRRMNGRGIIHFRFPSIALQAGTSFRPGGQLAAFLVPVHHRRFIAPILQFDHGFLVRTSQHVFLHGRFRRP